MNTVAWYCDGLGAGSPAGLHDRHTERPQGTRAPHLIHRSYSRLTGSL